MCMSQTVNNMIKWKSTLKKGSNKSRKVKKWIFRFKQNASARSSICIFPFENSFCVSSFIKSEQVRPVIVSKPESTLFLHIYYFCNFPFASPCYPLLAVSTSSNPLSRIIILPTVVLIIQKELYVQFIMTSLIITESKRVDFSFQLTLFKLLNKSD